MGKTGDHINHSVRGSLRKIYLFRHKLCINYGVGYWYPRRNCMVTCCGMERGIINEGGSLYNSQ